MTKIEIEILGEMFREGSTLTLPDGGNKDKACRKLASMFGWIQRETVCAGAVVHVYRISDDAAQCVMRLDW